MARLRWKWIGVAVVGVAPYAALGQLTLSDAGTTIANPSAQIGGVAAIDYITLQAVGPGTPLRHGSLIPGTESIKLNGQALSRGEDYMMDYAVGVVYLKVSQKAGDSMIVSYHFDNKVDPKLVQQYGGLGAFKFQIAPDALNLMLGMGQTERSSDGRVMTDNLLGWGNSFKLSDGTSLGGAFIMGNRQLATTTGGLSLDAPTGFNTASLGTAPAPTAPSTAFSQQTQFVVQKMQSKLFGGTGTFDYQDISKDFAGFGVAKNSGFDDATMAKLQAEKGLQRQGFSFSDMKFGGLDVSSSQREVKSESGGIYWQSFGLNDGPLKFSWNQQKVDMMFNRFTDISEADKAELTKEAGISRKNLGAELDEKFGKLTYSGLTINDDTTSSDIRKQTYALDTSKIKFKLDNQDISSGFTRYANLLDPEKAAFTGNSGLRRQTMSLQSTMFGAATPINFTQSIVSTPSGDLRNMDASIVAKTWSVTHLDRGTDMGYVGLGTLPGPEITGNITAISKMYAPVANFNPASEQGAYSLGLGVNHDYTGFTATPYKNWNVQISHLGLQGMHDKGSLDSLSVANKNSNFFYKNENLGQQFLEVSSLMGFEKLQLGTVSGLNRTDMGFNTQWAGRKLSISSLDASVEGEGKLNRTSLDYTDKKLDVQFHQRDVSSGFEMANQLVDSEKDLLAALQGYKEEDAKINYTASNKLAINATYSSEFNDTTREMQRAHNLILAWAPDKLTKMTYTNTGQNDSDPLNVMFDNAVEKLEVSRSLGKYGLVDMFDESIKFGGFDQIPDEQEEYIAYETKLNTKTSFRTEQTVADYSNGMKEEINTNTVSSDLTKRVGVSVTNTSIDRSGTENDEEHRNAGFWFDFGNGLRLSYGYARQLNGNDGNGTGTTAFAIGKNAGPIQPNQTNTLQPGNAGNFTVAGGSGTNTWEADPNRVQSFSNVAITTAKPFRFWGLKNVKLNLGMDSAADYSTWIRDNRIASVSGNLGSNALEYDYRQQVDQTGARGIDRGVKLQTDQSAKARYKATLLYQVRTLPTDQAILIRDYNFSAAPTKNLTITNLLQTNPQIANTGAFLGSTFQAQSSDKWNVDVKNSKNLTLGGQWQELIDNVAGRNARTAGLNAKLFEASGSPITLFYGLEAANDPTQSHDNQRYSIQFDQKSGPNQMFSFFVGNVAYLGTLENSRLTNGWTIRMDYQFRF